MSVLFTKQFWIDAAVRAVKTGAQAAVAVIGVGATGILDWDLVSLASLVAAAIVLSVLTSLASLDSVGGSAEPRRVADPSLDEVAAVSEQLGDAPAVEDYMK